MHSNVLFKKINLGKSTNYATFLLKTLCISFPLILCQQPLLAQELNYNVYKSGSKHIGTLTMNQKDSARHTVIYSETNVDFKVVFNFNLQYYFRTVFSDSILVEAQTTNYLNQSQRDYSTITRQEKNYIGTIDGQTRTIADTAIHYVISQLYYQEPDGNCQVFSERFGEWCNVELIKEGSYRLHLPNGRSNIYHYNQTGLCYLVEVDTFLASLTFELLE